MKFNKKDIVDFGGNAVTKLVRTDADTLVKHTEFFDDASLIRNEQIRKSKMLERGTLGLHENADYRMVISVPSQDQYDLWKAKNPGDYELLMSKNLDERLRGAKRLQFTHPQWVLYDRV